MKTDAKTSFMFDVPNDETGQYFLKLFKKYLNNKSYSFKKRSRGKRAEKARKDGKWSRSYDSHLPMHHAERFQLYMDTQKQSKLQADVWDLQYQNRDLVKKVQQLTLKIANIRHMTFDG